MADGRQICNLRTNYGMTMNNNQTIQSFKCVALVSLWLLFAGATQADTLNAAQQPIKKTSDKLYQILQTDREALKNDRALVFNLVEEVVEPHVDFDRVSALVLGKHWRKASPEQREEFKHQFKALLVNTYATAFTEFQDWTIHFIPMTLDQSEDRVVVRTEVLQPAVPPVAVDYRMSRNDEGQWQLYDVMIEGISMVTNYRTGFAQQIKRTGGLDSLIADLKRKNGHEVVAVNSYH